MYGQGKRALAAAAVRLLLPAVAIGLAGLAAGCGRSGGSTTAAASPPPKPASVAPTTPPLAAQVGGLDLTLLDKEGRPVARVTAQTGALRSVASPASSPAGGRSGFSAIGQLAGSVAVLYKNGKPAARMTADSVHADQATQTVVGIGSVSVRSLALPDTPAIRADRMTWRHATGTIQGAGHVLITRAPDLRLPGTAFTADTQLRTFQLKGGDGVASGTMGGATP